MSKLLKRHCCENLKNNDLVLDNEHLFLTKLHKKIISYAKNNQNLIITPHIGGYSKESLQKAENIVLAKLLK